MTVNGYYVVRSFKQAHAIYCPECDRIVHENPYWGLNKTKALHERGLGHKTHYIAPHPKEDSCPKN